MRGTTRPEQKQKTRVGLIDKAETLFIRHGIALTTTADIAKGLRVSHGTVFIHFPTRDDLVLAVVERFGERLSAALKSKLADTLTLPELLRAHLAILAESEDFYLRLISEAHGLGPKVRSIVYAMNSFLSTRFFEAAQVGMKNKEYKKIAQADFFNTWMALVHYQILNRDLLSDETPILKHRGEAILRHFLNLISNK